jgi:trk system potassium uptake protein TrkH
MSGEGERALRHAVRVRVVLRFVGELCLVLGVTALVPTLGAALFREFHLMIPYGLAGALLFGLGALARRTPLPRELHPSEALVVTTAVFVLSALVMSGPLVYQGIPWTDALFEAISGVTTTGLSTLASVEERSRTFLLARAWMQWVGGLGFVVLSLALILGPGVATRRLGAPSLEPADFAGSMRTHARRLLRIYLGLTGFGVFLLLVLGGTAFDAVVHTFSGVSTGGFTPRDASLAPLDPRFQYGVFGLCVLGAISLPLYSEPWRGHWKRVRSDPEARALLILIAVAGLLVFVATRLATGSEGPGVSDLALTAVSAQTGAGFSTLEVEGLPASSKAVLILSMITGGSVGSTAGGIKLLRLLLVLRLLHWLIAETRLPRHAVAGPTLSGQRLESNELLRAATVILLFLGVLVISWLPFLAYGYAPLEALFEVASAIGTVGLSVGITRPDLEPFLKAVLCMNMLLGRLEVLAVLVALSPRTWIGRRTA